MEGEDVLAFVGVSVLPMTPGDSLLHDQTVVARNGLITEVGARARCPSPQALLGIGDSAGTVEPGKRADLVLLPGNPLLDPRALRRPMGVMLAGMWLPNNELDAMLQQQRARKIPHSGGSR